ncbi:heavy metal translocating P-type ATPase [Sulfurisphaera ohwakuensis]|uniref:Cadmium-translocating P-type ATPase n=1 Tax=Sulfurisphaera ohwakuensis TaxID=69656 RepID=A0A650CI68_SULOH|nr:copper-translocating P-type ATPase [Sulfurisphaera ohwakuensis]MBB5253550.1 Cu2+-exporting ATPase [Sulfurisphaera ohwakuensis]QGR17428.1 cadmium-translocating P-type ATPase [Sulfurisphaera ohwakuensis]
MSEVRNEKKDLRIKREEELKIVGMHCATCVSTVSKAISSVQGVKDVNVNLASGNARVVIENARLKDIVRAVRKAGYDVVTQKVTLKVSLSEEEAGKLISVLDNIPGIIDVKINPSSGFVILEINPATVTGDEIVEELRRRGYKAEITTESFKGKSDFRDLFTRLVIASVFSFLIFIFPAYQLFLSIPVQFYSGLRFHLGFLRALRNKTSNMDTLVSLSSNIAWFYSLYSYLIHSSNYFFEASSLLITFILIGKTLEAYIKEKTSDDVIRLQTVKARLTDGTLVDSSKLRVGDVVMVKSGEIIPADGIVDEGEGYVNESIYTGETIPVRKKKGDPVIGGSILTSGFLKVYVTRAGNRTYISQVIEAIREAETTRLPIQSLVDKVSSIFVPVVIGVSVLAFALWYVVSHSLTFSILISVAVLASACPCPFGLATPMAVMVGIRKLVKKGIKVRNAESLERLREAKYIVFDKTGTITTGEFIVKPIGDENAIKLACAVEKLSSHPVGKAIASLYDVNAKVKDFNEFQGEGVYGKVNDHDVIVGKREFVLKNCEGDLDADVLVCVDSKVVAGFLLEDKIRDGVVELVNELKKYYEVIIATGDSSNFADKVGEVLGVKVYKGLSPDDKVELVRKLGKVIFVGDGVNDAQALKEALVGIAVSTGTDIAKYAGDIIVPSVLSIKYVIEQSKRTVRKIKENLAWAFTYNSVLIPISAGILYPFYLPPEYAALAMSMDSVLVSLWSFVQ